LIHKKVENNRILLYSWLPTRTYHKNLAIWNFVSLKSGEFGPFFSNERSFLLVKIVFFRLKFGEISQKLKTPTG
jgi:hypothetical protein